MRHPLLVMVVDDSIAIQRVLAAILAAAGHDVVVADSVFRAADILRAERPDVLLTDYTMPGLTGLDLVRRVRADPSFDDLPIFVVSSEREARLRTEMEAAGANGWLSKPICAATLLALVEAVSAGSGADRGLASAAAHLSSRALAR